MASATVDLPVPGPPPTSTRRCSLCPVSTDAAASSATANSAAFVAPGSPIANVATGTPAGICTIDRSESTPCRVRDFTGTPSTGSVVIAEFDSLEAAQAWADADPYVAAGVYAEVTVKPFKQVFPS